MQVPIALLARAAAGRLRLAGSRAPRGAGDRADQVAAEGDPPQRGARGGLGAPAAAGCAGGPESDEPGENQPSLREYLAAEIQRQTYTPVTADDFDLDRVPAHLRVTFASSTNADARWRHPKTSTALQHKLTTRARASVAHAYVRTPNALERDGLTSWDFDALPPTLDTKQAGNTVRAYPALVDHGISVSIRLMSTQADQTARAPRRRAADAAARHPLARRATCSSTSPAPRSWRSLRARTARRRSCSRTASSPASTRSSRHVDVRTKAEFERVRDRVSQAIMDDLFTVGEPGGGHPRRGPQGAEGDRRGVEHGADRPARGRPRATRRARVPRVRLPDRVDPTAARAGVSGGDHPPGGPAGRASRTRPGLDDRGADRDRALPGRRRHSPAGPGCRRRTSCGRGGCSKSCA